MTTTGGQGSSRISELSTIPFEGAASVTKYSEKARGLCRDLSMELDMGAEEIYGALIQSAKGHPLLLGVDVKLRARRVKRRLNRAAEAARVAAVECVKFHVQFRTEFADVLNPPKPKIGKPFQWKDE